MKFFYVANVKMPTEKAHGIHMAKMCEAFAREGLDVHFVIPSKKHAENIFAYYDVAENFTVTRLPTIKILRGMPWLSYWIANISFLVSLFFWFLFVSRKNTIAHTREFMIAFLMKRLGFTTVYEAHRIILKKNIFFWCVSDIEKIVTNSKGVAAEFNERGFKQVLSYPNGVDPRIFSFKEKKEELRVMLNLSKDKKIVMYTGHLYGWKGIDTAIHAAKLLRAHDDISFIFIGGTKEDIHTYRTFVEKEGLHNVHILGYRSNRDIPRYLRSADLLLLPNSARTKESVEYTSPIKLFEYMASGVPIIASNLPSIREILNDRNAIMVEPDNERAMADTILSALTHGEAMNQRASQALVDVGPFTWQKRAHAIVEFLGL